MRWIGTPDTKPGGRLMTQLSMTFLPIVDRELRVASRRRGTYSLRFWAAIAVIAIGFFLLLTASSSTPSFQIGKLMFRFQSTLAFGFCLLAGVFLTADTLSAEKREGTMGLLFLTDLKGVDVVLGKLVASSMQSVYALLAVLPIFGLPLLAGGVTAGEFWRMNLALLTTLVFSLVVGIVVSSLGRESRQTMAISLAVIVVFTGVLPALGLLEEVAVGRSIARELLLLPSPAGALTGAFDASYQSSQGWAFWGSIGTLWLLCLAGLTAASLLLPRTWQEGKRSDEEQERTSLWKRIRFRDGRQKFGWRHQLSKNPFFWLAARDRLPNVLASISVCLLGLLWFGFFLGIFLNSQVSSIQRSVWSCKGAISEEAIAWRFSLDGGRVAFGNTIPQRRVRTTLDSLPISPFSDPVLSVLPPWNINAGLR